MSPTREFATIDRLRGPGSVQSYLDFTASIGSKYIPTYLRISALLGGQLVIPETFALHNPQLRGFLGTNEGAADFLELCKTRTAVFSRRADPWNTSFAAHYERTSGVPNNIALPDAIDHARFLDEATRHAEHILFDAAPAYGNYGDHFRVHASRTCVPKVIDRLLDAAKQDNQRNSWQELAGLGRANFLNALKQSTDNLILSHQQLLLAAINQVYYDNIDASLRPYGTEITQYTHAEIAPYGPPQFTKSDTDAVVHEFILAHRSIRPFRISISKIARTPWANILPHTSHDTGRRFFEARGEYRKGASKGNFSELLESFMEYMRYLEDDFSGGSGALLKVAPARCRVGSAVSGILSVASFIEDFSGLAGINVPAIVPAALATTALALGRIRRGASAMIANEDEGKRLFAGGLLMQYKSKL